MKNKRKKQLRNVLFFMLVFTILLADSSYTAKAWVGSDHRERVESIVKNRLTQVNFSDKELELLYFCVQLPDKTDYRWLNPSTKDKQVKSLHGGNNYMTAIRYLYELSFSYLNNKSKVNDDTYIDNYYKTCTYIGSQASDIQNILDVNTILKRLLSNAVKYSGDYEMSNRKKAIKIFGFLCHTIGDTYAHSSLLPDSSEVPLEIAVSDFKTDGSYSAKAKWNRMNSLAHTYEISFVDLDNLSTGKLKVRGEEKYVVLSEVSGTDKKLLDSMSKDLERSKFEDYREFYRKRFDATYTVTKRLMYQFNDSLLLRDQGKPVAVRFDKKNMNYFDETVYKLRKYSKFYNSI